ncbi:hypothetical protein [Endozoicomonas sp. ALB115]|uniref:hypothetical protein n=1 Tax=Endozoicomonas sp. ALB115 TaxID=3403074 RepID=UPI003BB80461
MKKIATATLIAVLSTNSFASDSDWLDSHMLKSYEMIYGKEKAREVMEENRRKLDMPKIESEYHEYDDYTEYNLQVGGLLFTCTNRANSSVSFRQYGMHILVNVNANSGKREHLRLPKHCPPLFVA